MTETQIREALMQSYETVFQRPVPDADLNLMSPSLGYPVALYLYWLKMLDEEYQLPVYSVIEKAVYTDMTINDLTELLFTEMSNRGETH